MRSLPFAKSRPSGLPMAALSLIGLSLTGLSACAVTSGYDPARETARAAPAADIAHEIGVIATELADRAEARTPLGNARIQLGQLDAIQPRRSPYRQVSLLERDLRATEATVRHELSMALGNRVNLVGEGADLPTHSIEGEFIRTAESLELSLRLVELESDWIVSTARRRIDDFVPEFYDRRLQAAPQDLPAELGEARLGSPERDEAAERRAAEARNSLDALRSSAGSPASKTRALRPAYPSGRSAPVIVQAPTATDVLTTSGEAAPVPVTADPAGSPGDLPNSAQKGAPSSAPNSSLGDAAEAQGPVEPVASDSVPAGPIEFDAGPAAARLRATGSLPPRDLAAPEGANESGREQQD